MKVKSESEVAQSCPTLHNPMDCSLPGSSVHEIFQARILEWGAIAFSRRYTARVQIPAQLLTSCENSWITSFSLFFPLKHGDDDNKTHFIGLLEG